MLVDRCICHDVPFAELLALVRKHGYGLSDLQNLTRCGTACGMCLPYIRKALRTGEARLPIMTEQEFAAFSADLPLSVTGSPPPTTS